MSETPSLLERFGDRLSRIAARLIPDPFLIALALTLVVFVAGAILLAGADTDTASIAGTLGAGWWSGFADPGLLGFALQMCLVLVTGHALATAPPVRRALGHLAALPRTAAQATFLVGLVACIAGVLHWGLAAVVGAFLARELARTRNDLQLHYPLLAAAAYGGMVVWHGGLSGSAPLKVAEPAHFAADVIGQLPVDATLGSTLNLLVTGGLVVGIPLLCAALVPRDPARRTPPPFAHVDESPFIPTAARSADSVAPTWHERLLAGRAAGRVVGLALVALVVASLVAGGIQIDLNSINLTFFALGLLAHGSVSAWLDAVADGARGAGAILVQFPLYFGILGVLKASGAVAALSHALASLATPTTFPVLSYWSAGLVNVFVPSGGGQWAIQGEILLSAGQTLGVDPALTVMAFSYGDASTNLLQPFWALPLLAITGVRAKEIMGYTTLVALFVMTFVSLALFLFAAS